MHMSLSLAIFVFGFAIMMVGIFVVNTTISAMLNEVNRRREPGIVISQFGWNPIKASRVVWLYRSTVPNGALLDRRVLGIVMTAVGFASVAASGFVQGLIH